MSEIHNVILKAARKGEPTSPSMLLICETLENKWKLDYPTQTVTYGACIPATIACWSGQSLSWVKSLIFKF